MIIDTLVDVLRDIVLAATLWVAGWWLVLTGLSVLVGGAVLLALPPAYFRTAPAPDARRWRAPVRVARGALGVLLIAVGVALSVPGVPGQGVLTILLGLTLIGSRRVHEVERRLARRVPVLRTLNALRARFGRPPLLAPLPEREPAPRVGDLRQRKGAA